MSEKERPQMIIDYEANTDKLVRLGDVVDQFKGKAVPAKAEPGEFAVINLSDMTPNGIAYDDLKTFSEERRKLLRFLLEDGDVLIASKGTVQKVAVFEDQGKREVVASSNITVLRPKEKLRGFYIKFFLETDIGRAYLDYADKGKAVLNLSTADLLDIKIPEIPIVKQAYQMSEQHYQQEQQAISGELSRLFQKTFSTAKRVRTETNIGESAVSVAYAACSLARQIFESLSELTILLVGAGETIELVCRHLLRHGVKNMVISNRTLARAEALVEKLDTTANIQILPLEQLQQGLNQADIVISSTGSPHILMSRNMVEKAQIMRRYRPMLLVDIAVPRDIEESAAELDSVYHYTVDDLQNIIQHNYLYLLLKK